MRKTIQKAKIQECLCSVKTHPTAELVYKEVKKEIPQITLATVYRNLNQMAKERKVLRLEINKEYHYDGDITNHQHCVCEKCGEITDLFKQEINDFALEKITNFKPSSVTIIFEGICFHCQK
ncbi:MAG: transcriptional repressor [Nanoarchaeota archaeon]|nr:transcriptional repressor [Nanoarchaeota archaeon]MBU1623360.1 transcriptional repressor [Nanoarchaeota archaeon]MBU1973958.1 transcriptional repressor [Nanoarchaeota archaeon]